MFEWFFICQHRFDKQFFLFHFIGFLPWHNVHLFLCPLYLKTYRCAEPAPYSLHYDSVLWVEYSKSSNRFLSSYRDFAIREWNSKTGECEVGLIGLSYFMRSTQFDNNAGKVLSALCDGSIREWDIKTGNCINTYLGHKARVYSAIYDSTCTRIPSASLDKSVYEWKVNNENMFTECGLSRRLC